MNNIFTGALSYADDITLICPSICGINNMIDICCEYAKEYDITFNPTKTVCIKYGDKVQLNEHVVMNGNIIEWADNVRHLGNFVDATLSDQHHLDTNSLTSLQIPPNMGIALGCVLSDITNRGNKWANYIE